MNDATKRIQRTYLTLMLGNTLAASFIWGINTLFLLDAGLSNLQAFAANAFFTAGMMVFEIPTGVVADTRGRRLSYLLGTLTLAATTFGYWALWQWNGPFWAWAQLSVLLGLGFTFFSGAVEAWLVDALHAAKYEGDLETMFGRGQVVSGVAMLGGSVLGGAVAQWTNLGVPFLMRVGVLLVMFVVAGKVMFDEGFEPERDGSSPLHEVRKVWDASLKYGLGNPPVRYMMLAVPFTSGVGFYTFYALQPYLLHLYGNPKAYSVAGLAAALLAAAQMIGGFAAPMIRGLFHKRTSALILACVLDIAALLALGTTGSFIVALLLLAAWGLLFAAEGPIRQAYVNDMIPSKQRATVLSFDSLMGSAGGVVIQPGLGRAADLHSYSFSLVLGGAIQVLALPGLLLSRAQGAPADTSTKPVADTPQSGAGGDAGD